jgi:hypothetical protein
MLAGKIREVQFALVAAVLLAGLAVIGSFYLASAATRWLEGVYGEAGAQALVGVGALALVAVAFAVRSISAAMKKARAEAQASNMPEGVRELVDTVKALTQTAPIAAIALAVIAGFMLMRAPTMLPVVVGAFAAHLAPRAI